MANGGSDGSIIIDTELDNSGFQKGSKKMEGSIRNLVSSVDKIGKTTADSVYKAVPAINDMARSVQNAGNSAKQTATQIEGSFGKAISKSAASIKKLEGSLAKAKAGLSEYDREAASIQQSTDEMLKNANTPEQVNNVLAIEKAQMEALNAKYAAQLAAVQQITAELEAQRGVHANLEAQQQAAAQSAAAASATTGGGSTPPPNTVSGWQRFGQVLKQVGSSALTAAKNLARLPLNAVAAGFKKAVSGMKKFNTRSKQTSITAKGLVRSLTSLRTMLFSRVREMFITALFHGIRDNMKLLAQFSKEFDGSMSSIKNSMKGLSANLTVSLGGLLTAIEPMLTRIISAISRAISYLNALFAMLSGKSTVTVAKKQTDSYAASLGGAAGAAEELKRQVYGFDQLNKRSSDSDGGGGGGTSAGDLYEEVPIDSLLPDSIKNWFDQIKAAFEAGDWYGIGMIVSNGLSSAMTVVGDWFTTTLAPLGITWAANIGNLLNGLVDGFDWDRLGYLIGDGLNTAFSIFNTFLTTFNFGNFGAGLGTAINGALQRTDWRLIGETLANKFNGAINFLYGTVKTINWSQLGSSIAAGVNGLGKNINFATLGATLSTGIKGAFNAMTTALAGIDWYGMGKQVASFFASIDWEGVFVSVFTAIGAAFGGLLAFIVGALEDVWNGIVDYLSGWIEMAEDMGLDLSAGLLAGILAGIGEIASWIWNNVGLPIIEGFMAAFGINSPSTVMKEIGGYLVDGLLLGIKNGWTAITSFLSTGVSKIRSTLSIGWANIRSNASTSWQGIKTTISTAFDNARATVSTGLSNMRSSLSTGWANIRSQTSSAWSSVRSSVSTAISNMRSSASSGMSNIRSAVSSGWNSLKSATSSAWSSISSTVTSKWNSLKSTMQNTNWYSVGSNICSGIANGINAGWSWLKNTVSNLASNLLSRAKSVLGIHSPSRVFEEEVGQNIGLGMAKGISDTESNVLKTVSNLAQATVDNFDTSPLDVDLAGNTMIAGLDAVADRLTNVAATFKSITGMLTSMGGLAMPQIAAGTVIPPQVKITDIDGATVKVEGFDSYSTEMEDHMIDIERRLDRLIETIQKKRLIVDADSLEHGITGAQKSHRLSFGGV